MQRKFNFTQGEYYHIYSRGVDKRPIFLDEKDHQRFVKLLYLSNSFNSFLFNNIFRRNPNKKFSEIDKGEELVNIGAWCLMPNHFHILIREPDILNEDSPHSGTERISVFIKKLLTGYSMYFNIKYQRKGALFEGAFQARHIDNDPYLEYIYSYIHLNPIGVIDNGWKEKKIKNKVKAKKFLSDYKYSSYQDYSGKERDESLILNKKQFPKFFDSAADFDRMVDNLINFEEE